MFVMLVLLVMSVMLVLLVMSVMLVFLVMFVMLVFLMMSVILSPRYFPLSSNPYPSLHNPSPRYSNHPQVHVKTLSEMESDAADHYINHYLVNRVSLNDVVKMFPGVIRTTVANLITARSPSLRDRSDETSSHTSVKNHVVDDAVNYFNKHNESYRVVAGRFNVSITSLWNRVHDAVL